MKYKIGDTVKLWKVIPGQDESYESVERLTKYINKFGIITEIYEEDIYGITIQFDDKHEACFRIDEIKNPPGVNFEL